MNIYHIEILEAIKESSGDVYLANASDAYMGNQHVRYAIKVPVLRQVIKDWVRGHKDIAVDELVQLCTSLVEGESETEKISAGIVLEYMPKQRMLVDPSYVDKWLDNLVGWGEVDALCQNKFTYKDMLDKWPKWKSLLENLSQDQNINKRRASLVLLTGPVSYAIDERFADVAFANIDKLKHEKDILITKAISWLLRSMIYCHRSRVEEYIRDNAATLPAIAVRETKRKLETGKK